MATTSASANVLASIELLAMIFAELPREDAAHIALVCRDWVELARDVIWKTVIDPEQLFSLLAPIQTIEDGKKCFVTVPTSEDWQRFLPFAQRVRTFEIKLIGGDYKDVLHTLSVTLPFQRHLLPRLDELRWFDYDEHPGCPELICLFLPPTLQRLAMFTPMGSTRYSVVSQLNDLMVRCPQLRTFELEPTANARLPDLTIALCRLCKSLPLQSLDLPLYCMTPQVLNAATHSQTLDIIMIHWNADESFQYETMDWNLCLGFPPAITSGVSFETLAVLELAIPLSEMKLLLERELLNAEVFRELTVRCVGSTSRETTRQFCIAISTGYTALTALNLNMSKPCLPQPASWESSVPSDAITISELSPLTSLRGLTDFELMHEYPVIVTDAELLAFAERLPAMQSLMLNPCPASTSNLPTLTINCLARLAVLLPDLHTLGLRFDATEDREYSPAPVRFKALHSLFFNHSPTKESKRKEIALYLSTLIPEGPDFHTEDKRIWHDVSTPLSSETAHWKDIGERIVFAAEARRWVTVHNT